MGDTTIQIRDAGLVSKQRRIMDEGGAGITPYNAEHPDQRSTLLDALADLRRPQMDLIERLNREGDYHGVPARQSYTTFTPNASGPQGMAVPAPGRAIFVQDITVWATTQIAGRLQLSSGNSAWPGTGTFPQMDIGFGPGPGGVARLAVNAFVRSSDRVGISSTIQEWIPSSTGAAPTGTHYVGMGSTSWILADSLNFDAKKVIVMFDDSTGNGTGPSTVATCRPWLINKFYRDQGIDCRYILKAYSGSSSVGHETYRANGKYDFQQVDAMFYNTGINDAAQGVSVATRTANILALIAWKQKRYPKAKLVIFGTTPVQDATQEAIIATYRTADQATVAAANDPLVKFCNLGASFDRTVYANYVTSDPNGTAVHPRDQALTPLWEGGYNSNPGLRAWLLANLPAI
jgi:hypothetical protein